MQFMATKATTNSNPQAQGIYSLGFFIHNISRYCSTTTRGQLHPPCIALVLLCLLSGCASPSAANNKLRVENQALTEKIEQLNRQIETHHATIDALEKKAGNTLPSLPESRLNKLFTATGIQLGKLTSLQYPDAPTTNVEKLPILSVQVVPLDNDGQTLKAAGSFAFDLFDLEGQTPVSIGHFNFSTDESRACWFGQGLLYNYIFKCPLETKPAHSEILLRVIFTEELTGRQFKAEKKIK